MKFEKWGQLFTCIVNGVMLAIIAVYFLYVINKIKIRSNFKSKLRIFFVGLAFTLRFVLCLYDFITDYETKRWRLFIIYFIGIMFMLVYVTLIFRVIGVWTIFIQIENQVKPKSMD